MQLLSTTDLTTQMNYFDNSETFFSNFSEAWANVKCQVLKLETKQFYVEEGSKSWEEWIKGNFKKSLELFPFERAYDVNLYLSLIERHIDFIRCRVVNQPISDYVKWEFNAYKINAQFNEKIYCLFKEQEQNFFENFVQHDFLVFDKKVALVHNFNDKGKILGYWKTTNPDIITNFICIHSLLKASSIPYDCFMKNNIT